MSDDRKFYVGHKSCGCPVAVTVASGGRYAPEPGEIAEIVAQMIRDGLTVRHLDALPEDLLGDCPHQGADSTGA